MHLTGAIKTINGSDDTRDATRALLFVKNLKRPEQADLPIYQNSLTGEYFACVSLQFSEHKKAEEILDFVKRLKEGKYPGLCLPKIVKMNREKKLCSEMIYIDIFYEFTGKNLHQEFEDMRKRHETIPSSDYLISTFRQLTAAVESLHALGLGKTVISSKNFWVDKKNGTVKFGTWDANKNITVEQLKSMQLRAMNANEPVYFSGSFFSSSNKISDAEILLQNQFAVNLIILELANALSVQNVYHILRISFEKKNLDRHLSIFRENYGEIQPEFVAAVAGVLEGRDDDRKIVKNFVQNPHIYVENSHPQSVPVSANPSTRGVPSKYDLDDEDEENRASIPLTASERRLPVKRSISQTLVKADNNPKSYILSSAAQAAKIHGAPAGHLPSHSPSKALPQGVPGPNGFVSPGPQDFRATQGTFPKNNSFVPQYAQSGPQNFHFGNLAVPNIISSPTSQTPRPKRPMVTSYDADATNDFLERKYQELMAIQDEVVIEREVVRYLDDTQGVADQYVDVLKNDGRKGSRTTISEQRNKSVSYGKRDSKLPQSGPRNVL